MADIDNTDKKRKRKAPPTQEEIEADFKCAYFLPNVIVHPFDSIERAGVIPYTITEEGVIWFAMSIDAKNGELSDCGGYRTKDESVVQTATRELFEESIGIFNFLNCMDVVSKSPMVTNEKISIFFLRVYISSFDFDTLPQIFLENRNTVSLSESSSIFLENSLMYWISESDLYKIISTRTKPTRHCSLHASRVPVSRSFPKTRDAIGTIMRVNCVLNGGRQLSPSILNTRERVSHPLMYEKIRRVIFPNWELLIKHLRLINC